MKRICNFSIIQIMIFGLVSILNSSCDKEVDPKLLPMLTTTEVIKMTEATAYSGGNITSDAGSDVTSRGVCWSESPNPTIEDKKTIDAAGTGEFKSRITGLNPATTYYVRAYASNKKGIAYGLQVTLKTKSLTITTNPITSTTISSAVSGGTLETDGDSLNVTERGICWNTSSNPTIENSKIANGKGKGKYAASITGLQIATQYFVRAYAKNETGTFYGDELSFITTNGTMTLTTTAATSITAISATVGGSVPNDGGAAVTERGFCLSKLQNPTIANKIANGSGVGAFASNITGLEANTTYYVRVFATNSVGTVYGNEISFKTKDGIVTLTTATATSITANSATSGGTITNDGGAAIIARGICWSTNPNPTISDNKVTNGTGIGTYNCTASNLTINITYYLRAFATNGVGTAYGNEISFTTTIGTITLSTTAATTIRAASATSGGTITNDGGVAITARGICWSTNPNPTITDNKVTNGTGIGSYNCTASNLTINTTYYLRAFATNTVGTFYGNEISFVPSLGVGDSFQGGIIAYILQSGDPGYDANMKHGIIAAPSDQSTGAEWGCRGTSISGADGTAIGTGAQNTIDIVSGCSTTGIIAKLCSDLVLGGYSDWYLPSKDELNKLYLNKTAVGGLDSNQYWSSTEHSATGAWGQSFANGHQDYYYKTSTLHVRAVRAF